MKHLSQALVSHEQHSGESEPGQFTLSCLFDSNSKALGGIIQRSFRFTVGAAALPDRQRTNEFSNSFSLSSTACSSSDFASRVLATLSALTREMISEISSAVLLPASTVEEMNEDVVFWKPVTRKKCPCVNNSRNHNSTRQAETAAGSRQCQKLKRTVLKECKLRCRNA